MGKILYICGGRSFHAKNPGRKISGVVSCWREMGHLVSHVCGGDIMDGTLSSSDYGAQKDNSRWFRHIRLLDPVVRTISEYRDIKHNTQMYQTLERILKDRHFDLIWERSSRLHFAGLALAKKYNIPYVLEWKDNLVEYPLSLFRRYALKTEARKNHDANFIVVESDVLRTQLCIHGVDKQKILVAHNAVDIDQFKFDGEARIKMRKSLNIQNNETLIGYMGSYAFYHDTIRLVKAARLLRDHSVDQIKFLMVGAGREYISSYRFAKECDVLNTKLIMKNAVTQDEVPAILSALDIAVLPGSTEIICPIKVQEYMSCGLPTLIPDYPCNREVMSDGVTGMFFEPKNEQSLAHKILLLSKDPELRKRLGSEARQEVMNRFSWLNTWGKALDDILIKN